MKQLLRSAEMEGSCWFDILPHAEMAMNNAALPGTDLTPFYLNAGYHPCFEADVFSMHAARNEQEEDVTQFSARLHRDWLVTYKYMTQHQELTVARIDPKRRTPELSPGDLVLVSLRTHESQSLFPRGPLSPYYASPYKVLGP